jgi:hypothetical protein
MRIIDQNRKLEPYYSRHYRKNAHLTSAGGTGRLAMRTILVSRELWSFCVMLCGVSDEYLIASGVYEHLLTFTAMSCKLSDDSDDSRSLQLLKVLTIELGRRNGFEILDEKLFDVTAVF